MTGTFSSRAAAVSGTVVALLAAGALPAAGGLARTSDITIAASATTIRYPAKVTISGQVTGGSGGESVELRANPYPFAGFTTVAQGATAADGSYRFSVAPRANTKYQVVTPGSQPQTSGSVSVIEQPLTTQRTCNYCHPGGLPSGAFVVRQSGTWRYPAGANVPRSSLKMYVYAGFNVTFAGSQPAPGTRLHLLGARGSGLSNGGGRFTWHLAFRAPAGTRTFWFENCFRDAPGFGPLNGKHNCGVTRTVRLPAPYLG